MSRLLAVDLDEETVAALEQHASGWSVAIDRGRSSLLVEPDSGPRDVELLLLRARAHDSVRTAEHFRVRAPGVPVLIIGTEAECRELESQILFSPFLGSAVRCVSRHPVEGLMVEVGRAIEDARRRERHRQTIASMNRQLGDISENGRSAAVLLDRLLEVAPVGVVVTDGQGCIQALNPRAEGLFEKTCSEVLGNPFWTLVDATHRERVRSLLERMNGSAAPPAEVVPHGALTLEITGGRVDRARGGGLLVLLSDVTERVELIERLERANRRKEEFLAMLGHELRNPLAPIRTALDLMRLTGVQAFERERSIIERQVRHLVDLVDDLLDVSRITRGKLELREEVLEVSAFVADAIEISAPLLERHRHELQVSVPSEGLRVCGDRSRLAQVVANLLTNAAKYTPPEGRVTVRATCEGQEVVVSVRDTGPGIDPELLPLVFEPFVQQSQSLDRAKGGLGLGLAIVSNLVALHGGNVSATSELGRGSEFVVRLPVVTQQGEPKEPAIPSHAPGRSGLRILVVDDNIDTAQMLSALLRAIGHEIVVAHDGPSALTLVAGFRPDVALLDVGLPVMDGYELGARLREELGPEKPILIAVTGYGADFDSARATGSGFTDHIVKPVSLTSLRETLDRATSLKPPSAS